MSRAPTSQGAAREAVAQNEERRIRAARQAARTLTAETELPMVKCRVTKLGDGKISTGEHVAGIGEVHFEKGEEFPARKDIADALEDRGFVEIV